MSEIVLTPERIESILETWRSDIGKEAMRVLDADKTPGHLRQEAALFLLGLHADSNTGLREGSTFDSSFPEFAGRSDLDSSDFIHEAFAFQAKARQDLSYDAKSFVTVWQALEAIAEEGGCDSLDYSIDSERALEKFVDACLRKQGEDWVKELIEQSDPKFSELEKMWLSGRLAVFKYAKK